MVEKILGFPGQLRSEWHRGYYNNILLTVAVLALSGGILAAYCYTGKRFDRKEPKRQASSIEQFAISLKQASNDPTRLYGLFM